MKKLVSLTMALILSLTLAVPVFAAPVKLDGISLSEVTSTAKKTVKIRGKSETVTVYYVPKNSTVTFAQNGWYAYFFEVNGDYIQQGSAVGGSAQAGEKLKFEHDGAFMQISGGSTVYHISVGGSGSSSGSSTTKAPATEKPSTQKPSATSTTADKNTVKVAGQDRTLGQIQTYSSGGYLYTVNHGDTLYDITARFYGDGNMWRELQKVNQKYLSETKDGTIFVGFNLLIPAELNGVRANVE